MLSGKKLVKNSISCERNNILRNEQGVLAHLFRWTVYQTQLAYSWYPAACSHSSNNFWVGEKKLSRDVSVTQLVCQKVVGRQKEDWEWTKLMWQGRWSGGRERTEIVCVSVNQDTVSREAWSIYLDFLFCKYIPIRNSQNLVTTKVSVTSQKSELSLHYKA